MKESHYKSYDDLPLFLNAEMTARVLGVLPSSGYERMHELGFPVLCRRPHGGAQGAVHPVGERSHRRRQLKRSSYRDGFFLPNELFQLGLDYGEIAPDLPPASRQLGKRWYEREHGAQVHLPVGGAEPYRLGAH